MILWWLACTADPADVLAQAQPGVVLIVADRGGPAPGYGAGTVVDPQGHILTNLHVVAGATLQVMFYDEHRKTWSPLDGGLSRYLFENEGTLVSARLLRSDPVLDLALIQVDTPPDLLKPLPLREAPIQPGESVFALGHPQESLWSFTAGMVSALHQGVIQHDAPINQGNSGGPLIDGAGRVVGINTSRLFGGAEGMGFARPIALAKPLLSDDTPPILVDRSNPASAMIGCEHAIELAPAMAQDCFDWDSAAELGRRAAVEASRLAQLPPPQADALLQWMEGDGRALWIADFQASVTTHLTTGGQPPPPTFYVPKLWAEERDRQAHVEANGLKARLQTELRAIQDAQLAHQQQILSKNGLKDDLTQDGAAYREARRQGMRVEEVVEAGAFAWVRVAGRNLDGTPFSYSECWKRVADSWKQPVLCMLVQAETLPPDWPPPAINEALVLRSQALSIAIKAIGLQKAG